MKRMIVLFLMSIFSLCNQDKAKYFKIVEQQKLDPNQISGIHYQIVFNKDTMNTITYPIKVNKENESQCLAMIEELLSMEGDIRLCALPIMNWNTSLSQLYPSNLKQYTVQVESLFLINQIYLDMPFAYSPIPALSEKKSIESIDGELIKEAFSCYKEWFKQVKTKGLKKAKQDNLMPLAACKVKWLFGAD